MIKGIETKVVLADIYIPILTQKLRQEYLDGEFAKDPNPNVEKVAYDHGASMAAKLLRQNPDWFGLSTNAAEYIKVSPNSLYLEDKIKQCLDGAYAATLQNPSNFGKGLKSDIYVFARSFYKHSVQTANGVIEIPQEDRLRAILYHAREHANINARGMNLKGKVEKNIMDFIIETEAFLRQLEQLEKDSFEHLFVLDRLIKYMREENKMRVANLTPYEKKLVEHQKERLHGI